MLMPRLGSNLMHGVGVMSPCGAGALPAASPWRTDAERLPEGQRGCQLGRLQDRRLAAMLVGALALSRVSCFPSAVIV